MPKIISKEIEAQVRVLADQKKSHKQIQEYLSGQEVPISLHTISNIIKYVVKQRSCEANGEEFVYTRTKSARTTSAISRIKTLLAKIAAIRSKKLPHSLV